MATNFPTSLDSFTNPQGTDQVATVDHALQHQNHNDAIAALEAKVGINSSAVTTSLDYKVAQKQDTITGAATTITSSNLTASRALASDGSGKVAVSTVTSTELGYLSGVTSALQTQLNAKQATITGGATTIATSNLTVSRALVSDSSGKVAVSAVTDTELGYVGGVTSAIQTQLNTKLSTSTAAATYQPLDSDLTALANNSTNGLWARTGTGTGAARTLTQPSTRLSYSNADGVSGNPSIDINLANANTWSAVQSTSVGGQAGVGTNPYTTPNYVQSRLENLVTNGSGLLQNNYNFSTQTFSATETHGGGGSFLFSTPFTAAFSDEFIPVDTSKYYRLTGWGKSGETGGANYNPANLQYFGIAPYDIDRNLITPLTYSKFTGATDTTLAVTLVNGATTITLTDATGWNNAAAPTQRSISWYPYTNSKGYTYPDYGYTRNFLSTAWGNGGISGNVITLSSPWAGGTLAAGTKVRNADDGGTYKYIGGSAITIPNDWTKYGGYIGGESASGAQVKNNFTPGTSYVKLLFLFNYHGSADNNVRWSDLSFSNQANYSVDMLGSIQMFAPLSATVADATTYYFGSVYDQALTTSANTSTYKVPVKQVIRGYSLNIRNTGTLSSSETSTMYLRVNNTTDYVILDTVTLAAAMNNFSGTISTPIPLSAGDTVEVKWVTPTWTTNPTNIKLNLALLY